MNANSGFAMSVVNYVICTGRHFEWLAARLAARWERVAAQSVARIDTTKAVGYNFTDFLKILKEGGNGSLLYVERTRHQASSRGYAAATSLVERNLWILLRQRTILLFSAM